MKPEIPTLEEVTMAFKNFLPPSEQDRGRGGVIREDKDPYFKSHPDNRKYSPTYHPETSFTPEQLPYVKTAMSYLAALAEGKVLGNTDAKVPSFRERVVTIYSSQGKDRLFVDSILQASLDLLKDFSQQYPSLTPALGAAFSVAGAQGMEYAIVLSSSFLNVATNPKTTEASLDSFRKVRMPNAEFILRHPTDGLSPAEYEIACLGESVARIMIIETKEAAITLAQKTPQTFETQNSIASRPILPTIRKYVADLLEKD